MCPDTAPPARARAGRTASCARLCTLWPLPLPHTGEDVHAADRPHTPRHRVRTLPLWPLVSFPTQGSLACAGARSAIAELPSWRAACSAGALAAQLPAPSSEQLLLLLLSLFFHLPCLVAPPCNFELLVRAVLVPWGRGEHRSNERRRPALRKTGHEEGVFHEENELQKQEENGLVPC